jgi:4-hydroxy-3-methylbut-2-enyl diphosphate reductase
MRLAELARTHGKCAYLIDSAAEIEPDWFDGTETVLVTAGASAPEENVEECVAHLRAKYGATVETRTVREEHVNFPLPRELRVLTS